MRTRTRIKEVVCGDFLHLYALPVTAPQRSTRKKRFKPTRESMAIYNEQRAAKWLEELAETNFTDNDFFITLSYQDKYLPRSDKEALDEAKKYIRRLQYHCKKNNIPEPAAIWNIEKSKAGRYHHHMIIKCALSRDFIERKWGKGRINTRRLQFDENGLAGLSEYIQKFKSRVGVRRWHSTHNLKKPIQHENDRMSRKQFAELAENLDLSAYFKQNYKDYYLNHDSVKIYRNDINGCDYLYLKLYRKDSQYINSYLSSSARACKLGDYRKKKDSRPKTSRPPNNIKLQ